MIELPAVVKNLSIDTSLEPIDVRVFLVAVSQLDDVEFRGLKILPIATALRKSESLIGLSLQRLCAQGYLEIGAKRPGTANSFRISPFLNRRRASK